MPFLDAGRPGWCLLALLLAAPAAAETITPIAAILAAKDRSHGQSFCVAGKPSTVFEKYSRRGNKYFTVWLDDGTAKLKVFAFGAYPQPKDSVLPLEVCGRYLKQKMVSGRVFYDELDARVVLAGKRIGAGEVEISDGLVVLSSTRAKTLAEPPKPR